MHRALFQSFLSLYVCVYVCTLMCMDPYVCVYIIYTVCDNMVIFYKYIYTQIFFVEVSGPPCCSSVFLAFWTLLIILN